MSSVMFKKPQYVKYITDTGETVPAYVFQIDVSSSSDITFSTVITKTDIHVTNDNCIIEVLNDNTENWTGLVRAFVSASSQYFTRTYTTDILLKRFKHTLSGISGENSTSFPTLCTIVPKEIIIDRGNFIIKWSLIQKPFVIEDSPEQQPKDGEQQLSHELVEIDCATIPITCENAEELQIPDTDEINETADITDVRIYDKNRVKEAKIRAKLAQYKAERILFKYMTKYGKEAELEMENSSDNSSDSLESGDENEDAS